MTIRKKLLRSFGLVLAIMLLAFFVSMLAMWRERSTKLATKQAEELSLTAGVVRFHMMQSRLSLSNYLLTGVTGEVDRLRAEQRQLNEALQAAKSMAQSETTRAQLAKMEQVERDWNDKFVDKMLEERRLVDAGKASHRDLQKIYLQLDPQYWVRSSSEAVESIRADTQKVLQARGQTDQTAGLATTVLGLLCISLALGGGMLIAIKTSRSITEPLDELSAVARNVADTGDLNQPLELKRSVRETEQLARAYTELVNYLKEMAAVSEAIAGGDLSADIKPRSPHDTLALAFSKMTNGLRNLVRAVRDAASQVAAGSNQVADASDESAKISVQAASAIDEVSSTMHEMSVNVQNMVRNTQMQASEVGNTSASIDQMVANIQRVADTAKVLLDISNRSREEVQSGLGTMQKATEGLNRINESIGSSAELISALGQRADEIGKIVVVIDDISEQTNLLALNAAIEAARAGEHGLGFAVVADEVRKLAEKSAESAKDISELIDRIQKEARKAVDNMDKSTTIVNEGLNLGNDLNSALRRISNVVTEVYKFAHEIGAATTEQSQGSTQIAKATSRLNETTQDISSSVEEQAGGAHAVVRAMERMREMVQRSTSGSAELAASAEQMSKMASSLLEAVDRFILGAETLAKKLDGAKPNGKALAART
ncbi:MAG: methyl-accepting chemotaxis protein [Candidatus Korobacteraceae bacterium]